MKYGMLTFNEPQIEASRKILHVDMDAFYASIETRDNPTLANQPLIIAKHPHLTGGKGIVATCNYIARQYGVHSAMPAIEAYRLCPQATFIAGNMAHYRQVSQQIQQIFKRYTDLIEPIALDEAYLDITHNKINQPSGLLLARQIQADIFKELGLTCSVGVSYNKFIAKIASDYHKPKGITLVKPEEAQAFLASLPIEKFHGVGRKSIAKYHALGILTGADLYQQDLDTLIHHFGKMGYSLYFKVRGIHNEPVRPQRQRKSLGREHTFGQLVESQDEVLAYLEKLAQTLMQQLQQRHLKARTLTIKLRYEDFDTFTRQIQSNLAFDQVHECLNLMLALWSKIEWTGQAIRLVGLAVSNFETEEAAVLFS